MTVMTADAEITPPPNVLLAGINGSTAYGLATEDSDMDRIIKPCATCGARDRYPSGGCRPCGQRRNAENTEYWKNRNAAARAEALGEARVTNTRTGVIYGLFEPNGELRYIGQTQAGARRRLSGHLHAFKGSNRHLPVNRWIAKLAATGREPELRILAGPMPVVDLDDAEREHIAAGRAAGERLLNVAEGGSTHLKTRGTSADAIRRSAEAKRGKPRPPEVRAKLSAANKGKKQPAELVRKRAEAIARTKALNRRDACKHGHKWTEENTYWYRGRRDCRTCRSHRSQAFKERAAAREAMKLQEAA